MKSWIWRQPFIILVLYLLATAPFLSNDISGLHAWRQAQSMQNIINFIEEDGMILNPRVHLRPNDGQGIYRRELPLYQWTVAQISSNSIDPLLVGRIVNILLYVLSILSVFALSRKIIGNNKVAWLNAALFAFAPALFYFSSIVMPDAAALSFLMFSFYFFFVREEKRSELWACLAMAISIGMKLPFAIWLIIPLMRLFRRRDINLLAYLIISMIGPLLWYLWVIPDWTDTTVTKGFLAGNFDPILLLRQLIDLIPLKTLGPILSLMTIAGISLFLKQKNRDWFPPILLGTMACLAYLVFESRQIGMVHDYYLFPFFGGVIFFSAYGIDRLGRLWSRADRVILVLLILQLGLDVSDGVWKHRVPEHSAQHAWHISQNELQEILPAYSRVLVGVDQSPFIYLYYVNRNGGVVGPYGYDPSGALPASYDYLLSDDRQLEKHYSLNEQDAVGELNGIRIFELK